MPVAEVRDCEEVASAIGGGEELRSVRAVGPYLPEQGKAIRTDTKSTPIERIIQSKLNRFHAHLLAALESAVRKDTDPLE